MTTWFTDYDAGDAHLEPAGETQFADIAAWIASDPRFDFDGDLRPTESADPDYAGADVP